MAPRRSLRDEMVYGRPRRRRGRLALVSGLVVVLVVVAMWVAASVSSPPGEHGGLTAGASPVPSAQPGPAGPAPEESESGGGGGASTPDQQEQVESHPSGDVEVLLHALTTGDGSSSREYDRALFGQSWFDLDRNGCDTRNDMLRRDLSDLVLKSDTGGCKVLSGTLKDWYSGATVDFVSGGNTSRLVQIDHIVPLSWAWRHGADQWTPEHLRQFANDPLNLVATTERENTSKGDSGPADWLPSTDAAQCRYAQRFILILSAYDLQVGPRDRAMLRGVLAECVESEVFGAFATAEEIAALDAVALPG